MSDPRRDRIHIYVGPALRAILDEDTSGESAERSASRVIHRLAAAECDRRAGVRPLRDAVAALTHVLATCSDAQAEDVRTILAEGAGLMPLPDGAVLLDPAGLVPDRREAWCALVEALRLDAGADARWRPVRAGAWESVLATLLLERDWDEIARTARALRGEVEPEVGESTAPLTDDQVTTLVELARADRREDYDALCAALGVTNGPALWDGLQRRLAREGAD